MKYIYPNMRCRIERSVLNNLNAAADLLHSRLRTVDFSDIGLSEYNQRYWRRKMGNPVATLQLYTYLLACSVKDSRKTPEELILVDYGGGTGLLALLAKEFGIGRVIYSDIYDISCNDIKKVETTTGLNLDDHVCGDIDELIRFVNAESISVDIAASYDVIEHIYNIDEFFNKLRQLSSDGQFRTVFASSANIHNPLVRNELIKVHRELELSSRKSKWGEKECDSLQSYLSLRKKIIREYAPSLNEADVNITAEKTRGLKKEDIESCIDEYIDCGKITYIPNHISNTCDPITGNWGEHLMSTEWLETILEKNGYNADILCGYWPSSGSFYKNFIKKILNLIINSFGRRALCLSPYYVLYADKRITNSKSQHT